MSKTLDEAAGRSRTAVGAVFQVGRPSQALHFLHAHRQLCLAADLDSGNYSSIQRRWPLRLCQMYPSLSSANEETEAGDD